jgi:hypothetical protein
LYISTVLKNAIKVTFVIAVMIRQSTLKAKNINVSCKRCANFGKFLKKTKRDREIDIFKNKKDKYCIAIQI